MSKPLVIYHGGCPDGFAAAWCVHHYYAGLGWDTKNDVEFFAGYYGQDPPSNAHGRSVVMVDFSYSPELVRQLADEAYQLLILDHHKTAEEKLHALKHPRLKMYFDMDRSGAGMAWDYYMSGQDRPWFVNYVEDRDLWRWNLPLSKTVNAYLSTVPFSFASYDSLQGLKWDSQQVLNIGDGVQRRNDSYSKALARNVRWVPFAGFPSVPVVNAPFFGVSDLLNEVLDSTGSKIAMAWWQRQDGLFQYSLRSKGDYPDVARIAEQFGGGGHRNAAGFETKEMGEWLK